MRFSNGGGNPHSNDANREAHGMAVKLRPAGADESDILATTTPAFVLRTPEEFLELLRLRLPDPETGEADMEALVQVPRRASRGPDRDRAARRASSRRRASPPSPYFSPHSFRLLDADGSGTWVRYRWRPEAGEERIPDDDAKARGRDYLFEDLDRATRRGSDRLRPVCYRSRPPTIPSTTRPPSGPTTASSSRPVGWRSPLPAEDPEHEGHIDVFDPTRVGDGIELSDDPILRIRSEAYSVSAYKRLGQV